MTTTNVQHIITLIDALEPSDQALIAEHLRASLHHDSMTPPDVDDTVLVRHVLADWIVPRTPADVVLDTDAMLAEIDRMTAGQNPDVSGAILEERYSDE